ncbi:CapA family protein [Candidatus Saccharibacteria bacterium]|nr:CapA family protein [Candidatus Saccharibacteria bacterium]
MKSNRKKNFFTGLTVFIVIFLLAFFGIQFFTKTGIFRIPGVVYYDESLNASELELLKSIFTEEIDLDKDVTISAEESYTRPELKEGEYLYSISVPTADFYDTREDTSEFIENEYALIPIEDLSFNKKLLSMDGKYYLDTFDSGAVFRTIKFESEKYEDEIQPLVEETFTKTFPDKSTVLSFAQTGVTALSRGMNRKYDAVGGDATYFASEIGTFLSGFDLTHTSNESSFTDFASYDNICSKKGFINTLLAIGLDIVELTGNHNQDCGDVAATETIDIYNANNIKIVGGGKTADEAAIPLEISEKGNNITFLAYNLSTGGATYDNSPGANQYYEEKAVQDINAAKARGDFVLVDIQYYECSAYASEYEDATCDYANSAAGDQVGFFRHLIDLGADMVVGTSAHQPQTYELYGNGVIYYGLGNLFFDQVWWPGTTRSLILANYYYEDKLLQTKIVPTVYDADMQTKLMDKETSQWFLNRLISVRP